ncbi:hypothetical protein [Natronosalvus halobius]|uniref:hypothetical protein n=1 Tax=Natronosalvus halobius TaxID=2953746 RepID=UPI0020A1ADC1|nr:hypothetical protein [Natronosalvus halobius]USZ72801.1 hypothetical protein NGM15_05700 [Natronosalvus halobius]
MALPAQFVVALVGAVLIGAVTIVVYRDADRLEFERPWLWAAVVAVPMLFALSLHVVLGTVPIPGLLVLVVAGLAFYAFERDDTVHGDETADPHVLPGGSDAGNGAPAGGSDTDHGNGESDTDAGERDDDR